MASRQQIKRRIKSVKSTKQITKAMQLVAASKLRKAQDAALGPRAYAQMARQMLVSLRRNVDDDTLSGLFDKRPIKNRMLVVITSDRGLAGAYNSNVIRAMISELQADEVRNHYTAVVCVGKQAARAASRIKGLNVMAVYSELPDKPSADDVRPILHTISSAFSEASVDAVDFVTTKFHSTVSQAVAVERFLPAGDQAYEGQESNTDLPTSLVEPSIEILVQSTMMRLLDALVYQALLEAAASEHSMRMLAMKNATDNATDIIDDLTLEYNNARQAAITQELAEITGGAEAIN